MDNESMNIGRQGIEQDRTIDNMGFGNVGEDVTHMAHETVPFEGPMPPLQDATVRTSNTQMTVVPDLPATGGTYTLRGALDTRTGG